MAKPSQTSILTQLLSAAVPGAHDETLDDVAILGSRGGMRGYERAPGAARLATNPPTRVINAAVATGVRHGTSFAYEPGGRHRYAKSSPAGPTFDANTLPVVEACVWAASAAPAEVLAALRAGDAQTAVSRAVTAYTVHLAQERERERKEQQVKRDTATARKTSTSPEELARLAVDEDWNVRTAVAGNTRTPPEVLERLADDAFAVVRIAIAKNTHTPPGALALLATSSQPEHLVVAKNTRTPPEVLAALASDKNAEVRVAVAGNTHTPPEAHTLLASGDDQAVLEALAANEHVATEIRMAAQLRAAR